MTLFEMIKTRPYEMQQEFSCGVRKQNENEVLVSVWRPKAKKCQLAVIAEGKRKLFPMYPAKMCGMEDYFTVVLQAENLADRLQGMPYFFVADGESFCDSYARMITGREYFGRRQGKVRACFDFQDFDWTGENWKKIPARDMILYQCHVRGFTKHKSSNVKNPGTFSGMEEKLSYLKDLGVNTLLLMPAYDFNECMHDENGVDLKKVNYWGYTEDAFYFAPKAGYAAKKGEQAKEFQKLIKAVHSQGMNVVMDFYFKDVSPEFMLTCMRYYALRFHIDGFRFNQECVSVEWLRQDPVLSHLKLFGYHWDECGYEAGQEMFCEMNDRFLVTARRFLKSDEGQVEDFYYQFREQKKGVAMVHSITGHNGFTLRDLVSYDVKHNEANGEKNLDGTEYNYSWNCGAEGPSRKKEVREKRSSQERNAFLMLMLGMASPRILSGDEFGNTQKGNNNAYCQDNAITWLDWSLLEKNKELFSYVKKLIEFRRNHPLYQSRRYLTGMDSEGLGAPDVSCHGVEPWNARFSYYSRELGVLFFGGYYGGNSLYFAFNFHWEPHVFYLPEIEKNKECKRVFDTSNTMEMAVDGKKYELAPRSIAVFENVPVKKTAGTSDKKKIPAKGHKNA